MCSWSGKIACRPRRRSTTSGALRAAARRGRGARRPRCLQSILNYVRRSRERVLLDDAAARAPVLGGRVFRAQAAEIGAVPPDRAPRPGCSACSTWRTSLVTGAFTPGRLSVLELLASQSAISLENAMLYADLEQENAERRRAEQALKRQSRRPSRPSSTTRRRRIYLKDREGRYLLVNRQVGNLLRVPSEQILGKTDAELFPAPVAETIRDHDRKVLEAGAPMEWEEEVPLEDGLHTFLSVKFPLGGGATPRALCGISTDITERKRAEQAERFLAEASRKLMALGYGATLESVAQLAGARARRSVPSSTCARGRRSAGPDGRRGGARRAARSAARDALRPGGGLADRAEGEGCAPTLQQAPRLLLWSSSAFTRYLRVPLLARDRCFGVMTLLATAPERRYGPADLRLAEELGRRRALALDNAAAVRRGPGGDRAAGRVPPRSPLTSSRPRSPRCRCRFRCSSALVAPLTRPRTSPPSGSRPRSRSSTARRRGSATWSNELARRLAPERRAADARACEPVDLAALAREVVERMGPQLAARRLPDRARAWTSRWSAYWDRVSPGAGPASTCSRTR